MIRIGFAMTAALVMALSGCSNNKTATGPETAQPGDTPTQAASDAAAAVAPTATEATPTEAASMGKLADGALVASGGGKSSLFSAIGDNKALLVYYRGHW